MVVCVRARRPAAGRGASKDRLSFCRFFGLSLTEGARDETTFVVFRRRLREAGLYRRLFTTHSPFASHSPRCSAVRIVGAN